MSGTEPNPAQREKEIFLEVVEFSDPDERAVRLEQLCGSDEILRKRVERLLAMDADGTLFMKEDDRADLGRSPVSSKRIWEPPAPDVLDSLLDAYRVESLLGRGGMGAVYRGVQISLDRPVAIKILPPEYGAETDFAERFRREALAMARLDHPNIVGIYDFGSVETETGILYFFVMEFVSGTDLYRVIHSGALDVPAALDIVRQVCDALYYAHNAGFLHRDIKPANIFISESGVVKVGDFGLAKLVETTSEPDMPPLTRSGFSLGTPQYMAPESLGGKQEVDQRADIYSLGVMFYEMLTGNLPHGVFPPPSEKVPIDSRLDDVVLKAMNSEPAQRYQQVSEVKSDIDEISSTEVPKRSPAVRKKTRKVALLSGVGAMVAVAAAFLFFKFSSSKKPIRQAAAAPEWTEPFELDGWNWSKGTRLPDSVNSSSFDITPDISTDGKTLVYTQANRIMVSQRSSDGVSWEPPVKLDILIEGAQQEGRIAFNPAISGDGNILVFATHLGKPRRFFQMKRNLEGTYSDPVPLSESLYSIGSDDQHLELSDDGLTLVFASNRNGGMGNFDIYVSERETVDSPFGKPELVTAISSDLYDMYPKLVKNGTVLIACRFMTDWRVEVRATRREGPGKPFSGSKYLGDFQADRDHLHGFTLSDDLSTLIWAEGTYKDRNLDLWKAQRQDSSQ